MNIRTNQDRERGARIKYVRRELLDQKSQEEFAAWIGGVTRGAVGNWERGLDISLDNMVAIADKAGISLEWLAYNKGPRPTTVGKSLELAGGGPSLAEALELFRSLPMHQQKLFLQHVLDLATNEPE